MSRLSRLTRERPDLWSAGLTLSTGLTGVRYTHKSPMPDGAVYACGGGGWESPSLPPQQTPASPKPRVRDPSRVPGRRDPTPEHIKPDTVETLFVVVPEGAMEWLLHEVGHWIAADETERRRQNYGLSLSEYGHDGEREWQAWAFEEIVLAPFGPSRLFAPPSQRDGAAYAKTGPMPEAYLRHVEREIARLCLDVEQWRQVWGEWVRWGTAMGAEAPWRSVN